MNSITIAALMLAAVSTTSISINTEDTITYEDCHCDFAKMADEGIDEYEETIRIFEQVEYNENEYDESR